MFESEIICRKHGRQYSPDGRDCDICLIEWKEEMIRCEECKHEWTATDEAIFEDGNYADVVCLDCDIGGIVDEQGRIIYTAPTKMSWE